MSFMSLVYQPRTRVENRELSPELVPIICPRSVAPKRVTVITYSVILAFVSASRAALAEPVCSTIRTQFEEAHYSTNKLLASGKNYWLDAFTKSRAHLGG